MDIAEISKKFLLEQALILVPVLMFFGYMLKKTPYVVNWLIPWLLMILGIIGGLTVVGMCVTGVLQGIIAAGVAVFSHQLFRQRKPPE